MIGKNKLISVVVLIGILLSPSVYSFKSPRNGAEVRGPNDRDVRQQPTLKPADYEIAEIRAGNAPAPGTPVSKIKGDTPPPSNSEMGRMTGPGGTFMGDHN